LVPKLSHPQATLAREDPPQSSSGFHLGEPLLEPLWILPRVSHASLGCTG
jgi:hypothetical protein